MAAEKNCQFLKVELNKYTLKVFPRYCGAMRKLQFTFGSEKGKESSKYTISIKAILRDTVDVETYPHAREASNTCSDSHQLRIASRNKCLAAPRENEYFICK